MATRNLIWRKHVIDTLICDLKQYPTLVFALGGILTTLSIYLIVVFSLGDEARLYPQQR
jgi:hypothetical protein